LARLGLHHPLSSRIATEGNVRIVTTITWPETPGQLVVRLRERIPGDAASMRMPTILINRVIPDALTQDGSPGTAVGHHSHCQTQLLAFQPHLAHPHRTQFAGRTRQRRQVINWSGLPDVDGADVLRYKVFALTGSLARLSHRSNNKKEQQCPIPPQNANNRGSSNSLPPNSIRVRPNHETSFVQARDGGQHGDTKAERAAMTIADEVDSVDGPDHHWPFLE
jgi:hypothetical protein